MQRGPTEESMAVVSSVLWNPLLFCFSPWESLPAPGLSFVSSPANEILFFLTPVLEI